MQSNRFCFQRTKRVCSAKMKLPSKIVVRIIDKIILVIVEITQIYVDPYLFQGV